jgi:hypothetical protein
MAESEEYRSFTVEAKVRLIRHRYSPGLFLDDEEAAEYNRNYEENIVKVDHKTEKPLKEFAEEEIKGRSFWMWLYYTTDLSGTIFHVLEKEIDFSEHTFTVNVKARYICPNLCTKEHLKKSVNGIFDHWFNAGCFSYHLVEFNIVSAERWGSDEVVPGIFVNLI